MCIHNRPRTYVHVVYMYSVVLTGVALIYTQVSMANVLCWLVAILCWYETMGQKTRESITHVA